MPQVPRCLKTAAPGINVEDIKMKKLSNILLTGLALVAAVSCNKQNTQGPEEAIGVPMTLTATIGGPETKLGFTKDGNVLKGTWAANEKVSVLTINAGTIITIDTFQTGAESEGQTTAAFTGTFTGNSSHEIKVIYPALENYSGSVYGTPLLAGAHDDTYRMISTLISDQTYNIYMGLSTQSANGSTDHLGAFSFMLGTGSVSGSNLSTTLAPQVSVLQVNISFADALIGKTFAWLACTFKDGFSNGYFVDASGGQHLSYSISANKDSLEQFYGSWSGTTQTPITLTASDKNFVAYIPFVPGTGAHIGGLFGAASIEFDTEIDGAFGAHTKTVNLTNPCTLESGKLYRVSVTIE